MFSDPFSGDATQRKHLVKPQKDYLKELEAMELEEFVASEQNQLKKPAKKSASKNTKLKKAPAKKKSTAKEKELEYA